LFYEGIIYEDELYARQLFLAAKKIYFLKIPLYNRRLRYESTTTAKVSLRKPYSFLIVAEELYKMYSKYGNIYLKERSENLYKRAIKCLENFSDKPPGYKDLLKKILNSDLRKEFKIDFKTVAHLQVKEIKKLQYIWANLRYKLGARTRIKNLLKIK
jgi:hypothetical protein